MSRRFRQFLPVVIDVETGGFNCATDALLEIAAVMIEFGPDGRLQPRRVALPITCGPSKAPTSSRFARGEWHRSLSSAAPAIPEKDALGRIFTEVRTAMKAQDCRRAVLVGHNAAFDLGFLNAAVARAEIKRNPFHPFSCFDTATLAGAAFGQTVLAKAAQVCGIAWDSSEAHSAQYDAERTADIFCEVCNALDGVWRKADVRAQALWSTRSSWAGKRCQPGSGIAESSLAATPIPARHRLAVAPASVSSFFSSPLRCMSSTMSQPPTSSPFTYSCG